MKKVMFLLVFVVFISCKETKQQNETKEKKEMASDLFAKSIVSIEFYDMGVNVDSIKQLYCKIHSDSIDAQLKFAEDLKIYADTLSELKSKINKQLMADAAKNEKEEEAKWFKSKAGKIQKKHPEWTKEDCERLANKEIWVGMEYDMVVYLRGKPDKVNTSDYGKGKQYQCCWNDYNPSYFYCGEDGIITAYN